MSQPTPDTTPDTAIDTAVHADAVSSATQTQPKDRPAKPAILRGFRRCCPSCGRGHLFDGYLKVRQSCAVCGQELYHHRADDGPAYLTILIVGHIMAPLIHIVFTQFRPDPLILATGFTIFCVALSLYLLPRLKGVVVAIQWSRRMHGFGAAA